MPRSRRAFLAGLAAAAAGALLPGSTRPGLAAPGRGRWPRTPDERAWLGLPEPARHWRGASSIAAPGVPAPQAARATTSAATGAPLSSLAARFPDLRRRFVFEYYPWYDTDPWYHWNEADRNPPIDITASSMPRLGPYDTYDLRVLEQHARWIAEAGAGAINMSWWGRGDYTDLAVPRVMDVMRDHDIKVTFHLEPYRDDRARSYADDVLYLLREYGDKRGWDAFLLLDEGEGRVAPVFKSFRTILPSQVQDCLGRVFQVPDYTPDEEWRRQTDAVREGTRRDFSRVWLLADSLDVGRTTTGGFDGLAVYDNFVTPPQWTRIAQDATDVGLVYSFNVNPGFDRYPDRQPPPPPEVDPCYGGPLGFEPGGTHPDWADTAARRAAQALALARVEESFEATTTLQTLASSPNAARRFFLTYVNSFNEWHEGSQFEPARDYADLSAEERRIGYHNPPDGTARLRHLRTLLDTAMAPPARAR
ncbi:hypothetical protein [Luteitalea sp.]|jgi:hypothetical protein|uniref:hypothetical protein n=1 Tax=Luteitalea sp. TaxID=2004800 RepID=UPI0037CB755F